MPSRDSRRTFKLTRAADMRDTSRRGPASNWECLLMAEAAEEAVSSVHVNRHCIRRTNYVTDARNIVWEDLRVDAIRSYPFYITQCTSFSGYGGQQCETSQFKIEDILWTNIRGTSDSSERLGYLDCSEAAGGCSNITLTNVDVRNVNSGNVLAGWRCGDVNESTGVCGL